MVACCAELYGATEPPVVDERLSATIVVAPSKSRQLAIAWPTPPAQARAMK